MSEEKNVSPLAIILLIGVAIGVIFILNSGLLDSSKSFSTDYNQQLQDADYGKLSDDIETKLDNSLQLVFSNVHWIAIIIGIILLFAFIRGKAEKKSSK